MRELLLSYRFPFPGDGLPLCLVFVEIGATALHQVMEGLQIIYVFRCLPREFVGDRLPLVHERSQRIIPFFKVIPFLVDALIIE